MKFSELRAVISAKAIMIRVGRDSIYAQSTTNAPFFEDYEIDYIQGLSKGICGMIAVTLKEPAKKNASRK